MHNFKYRYWSRARAVLHSCLQQLSTCNSVVRINTEAMTVDRAEMTEAMTVGRTYAVGMKL